MPNATLLAISHGTASPHGQAAVAALVAAVAARLPDVPVRLGHVDVQQPDVTASLTAIGRDQPVVIVPLLLSAGYHVHVDLVEQSAPWADATIAGALGPDPRLAALLAARLADLHGGPDDAVVLAVAGSSDERANEDCRATGRMLADLLGRDVEVGFLAAADPRLGDAVEAARSRAERVLVANYLLAPGYFHDLAVQVSAGAAVARPLLDDAPAVELVDIVVDRYRAAC
ncbi:sirohydrochlorin chelatase [Microbacterium thalassium]|uniref:Sirohydrochlorin ferrochelatase n=1 Tax=Microbacterium thalassium TaxID=362649 RepID=A0A7X0KTU6_9MICO|nr:CbiX/SirB N-terminal domain-containing protein [Microbacterium thalassium]MBB6390423.1 sirohydrochlorin ferrochelatase [Microbacterium thalassium]GLK25532.1 cobalamin biosynthesis protein CbiX [Microbacterium thalassium]